MQSGRPHRSPELPFAFGRPILECPEPNQFDRRPVGRPGSITLRRNVAALAGKTRNLTCCVVARSSFGIDQPGCLGVDESLICATAGKPGQQHVQSLRDDEGPASDPRPGAGHAGHHGQPAAASRIFPDYPAPIVRNTPDGVRELAMVRWGMPSSKKAIFESAKKRPESWRPRERRSTSTSSCAWSRTVEQPTSATPRRRTGSHGYPWQTAALCR